MIIPYGFMTDRLFGKSIQFDTKQSEPTPVADPTAQAKAINDARAQYDPEAAKRQFDILTDPNYGILPFTQYQESVRQNVFPQEQAVRSQLAKNILANLTSSTGISPEQQAALDARRSTSQGELVKALRNRANVGGTLYGGNAGYEESRAVGDLQNQFAEEDIGRQERSRNNAIQGAIPFLQLLFPGVNIGAPNFQSPVQSADTYANNQTNQYNTDSQVAASANASQNALYSALFNGLGQAGGMALGAGGIFGKAAAAKA